MLRAKLLIAISLAFTTLAGCGDPAGSGLALAGEYQLQTINGARVPAAVSPTYTIESATLVLRQSGRFAFTVASASRNPGTPVPARQVATEEGTYSTRGSTFTLRYDDQVDGSNPTTGVVSGTTATLSVPHAGTWVFVR